MSEIRQSQIDKVSSYTANGSKYFYHPRQIESLLNNGGHSVIAASIAPTNACNLHCSYCNQHDRKRGITLPFEKIQAFVNALTERGLKAVILAGGGEPTTYRDFNKTVKWLKKDKGLSVALITNGTNDRCGNETVNTWDCFDWIRISLNFLNKKLIPLKVPTDMKGKVGLSTVYTDQSKDMFRQISDMANIYDARFVRVIPDYFKGSERIKADRKVIEELIEDLPNKDKFFIQDKVPTKAKTQICYISKIKPFLLADGKVATCDCFMCNKKPDGSYIGGILPEKFNAAHDPDNPASYIDYLDGKYNPGFDPQKDCCGCGYITNNLLLQQLFDLKQLCPDLKIEELFEKVGFDPQKAIDDRNFV